MSLRDQLSDDLKTAMREKDKVRLGTLRLVQTEIKKADIALKTEGKGEAVDEVAVLALMQKMVKQRQETIKIYQDNGRTEAAEGEAAEIRVIEAYLPQMKDEAETKALVEAKIAELGADSMKDMGKVVGAMKAGYPGELDMALTSKLIKAALS